MSKEQQDLIQVYQNKNALQQLLMTQSSWKERAKSQSRDFDTYAVRLTNNATCLGQELNKLYRSGQL